MRQNRIPLRRLGQFMDPQAVVSTEIGNASLEVRLSDGRHLLLRRQQAPQACGTWATGGGRDLGGKLAFGFLIAAKTG